MRARLPILPTVCALFALVALGGCRAAPAPFTTPPLALAADCYTGSVLRGMTATPVPPEAVTRSAPRLRCSLLYLERVPETGLTLVTGHTRVLAATLGGKPIQVASDLLEGSRLLSTAAADDFAEMRRSRAFKRVLDVHDWSEVIPRGVTTLFTIAPPAGTEGARRIGVSVSLPSEADALPVVALVAEQPGKDAATGRADLIVLDEAPAIGGSPLTVVFPSPLAGPAESGFAMRVELLPPTAEDADPDELAESDAAIERCRERLGASASGATEGFGAFAALRRAVDAPAEPRLERPVLVFIGGATGAELAQDIALAADDAALAEFAKDLAAAGIDGGGSVAISAAADDGAAERASASALGFKIDCVAWRWLARLVSEGKLGSDLEGILLRHAGAAGRYPGTILDVVQSSADRDDLLRRIRDENLSFLEDADPGVRVRAFDWLTLRRAVPPDYSPLAPVAERRAALKRARDAAEAAARAPASGTP